MLITRRDAFQNALFAVVGMFTGWFGKVAESALSVPPPEGHEILSSFDARDWAKAFVACQKANPAIATDEETMATWFDNALMRGFDEHSDMQAEIVRRSGLDHVKFYRRRAITEAVARGWCADENRHKEMDVELASAITDEVLKLHPWEGVVYSGLPAGVSWQNPSLSQGPNFVFADLVPGAQA